MDETIRNLKWTDDATKQMLQNVVKRKRKFDKYKKLHIIIIWLTIFLSFLYIMFIYKNILSPYSYSFAEMFSAYVRLPMNEWMIVILFGLFGYMNVLKKKVDKYEKEFHLLRCEIIDKAPDLWREDEDWKNRHHVFQIMKAKYDINLYHENK